jgi:hypothetical protein
VAHVDAEDIGAGLEQAGWWWRGRMKRGPASPRFSFGAGVSSTFSFRRRPVTRGWGWRRQWRARSRAKRLFIRLGELYGPGTLFASIDFEESCPFIASREAVVDAPNGELLVLRAHEGLSRPFAAALIVERVDVVKARHQRAAQQGLAAAAERFHQPSVVQPSLSL